MRETMRKLILIVAFLFILAPIKAQDVYLGQNAVGAANGADCADTFPVSFFSNSANWPNPIGPGTTVHLCGTITAGSTNTNLLTFRGDGTSTKPITVFFEPGAILQSPAFGKDGNSAISAGGSWHVIDGGTNGLIQNTANGSTLANRIDTRAIQMTGCNNCIVRNLTIANLYVHSSVSDASAGGAEAIYFSGTNTSVYNCTFHDIMSGIYEGFFNDSGNQFYNNNMYNVNHGIEIGNSGNNSVTGTKVYGNQIHDYANWDTSANAYHHDGVYFYAISPATNANGLIYNNYFYGSFGNNATAHLFFSNAVTNLTVFNNVFIGQSGGGNMALVEFGNASQGLTTPNLYNNTIIGPASNCLQIGSQTNITFENNVVAGCTVLMYTDGTSTFTSIDYNQYGNASGTAWQGFLCPGGRYCQSFAQWQAAYGEAHSSYNSNQKLSSTGVPLSSSPVIEQGANLTFLGITPLNLDSSAGDTRTSILRPPGTCSTPGTASCWDVGAYQFGASATLPPAPSGLAATVEPGS
jgi:hypothetical protein